MERARHGSGADGVNAESVIHGRRVDGPHRITNLHQGDLCFVDYQERDRICSLNLGDVLAGPALICEAVATTWLAEGWQAQLDPQGHLLLKRIAP